MSTKVKMKVIETKIAKTDCPIATSLARGEWYHVISGLIERQAFPACIHRVLLYGPPGTGKTTCPHKAFGQRVESVTLHQQLPPDDLIGAMGLVERNGATVTVWQDGPAVRAMRNGSVLIINEISKRSPECESALYNILDDLTICRVTLPTGETVEPAPGFCVVGTTNDSPSVLPQAIQERFDIKLECKLPAPGILEGMPEAESKLVSRHYQQIKSQPWSPDVSVRSISAANRLSAVVNRDTAYKVVFGHRAGVEVMAAMGTM